MSAIGRQTISRSSNQILRFITLNIHRRMSQKLYFPSGDYISYFHSPGVYPAIMFLPGLMSNMSGTKARALERFCRESGRAYTRFDHRGLGESSGNPKDCTVSSRIEDVVRVLREIKGPHILVGSSLGGWVMLHVAITMSEQIKGLVGIATAVDFIIRLFRPLSEKARNEIKASGKWILHTKHSHEPYVFPWNHIEDAENHALQGVVPISCPVRLIHGMQDTEVPYQLSVDLPSRLQSKDVQVLLIKDGGHRLSEDKDLQIIQKTIEELISQLNMENVSSKI